MHDPFARFCFHVCLQLKKFYIHLKFDKHFTEAVAREESAKGFRGVFDPLDDGLLPMDLSLFEPLSHIMQKGEHAVIVIVDDKA